MHPILYYFTLSNGESTATQWVNQTQGRREYSRGPGQIFSGGPIKSLFLKLS
jgi:hypothetical protein